MGVDLVHRLFSSGKTQALEAHIRRLEAENQVLLSRALGIAGAPATNAGSVAGSSGEMRSAAGPQLTSKKPRVLGGRATPVQLMRTLTARDQKLADEQAELMQKEHEELVNRELEALKRKAAEPEQIPMEAEETIEVKPLGIFAVEGEEEHAG